MIYLFFLGGVALGSVITRIIIDLESANGYFKVEPYRDEDGTEGLYTVNVRLLTPNQELLKKKHIILHKDHSQK